MLVPGHDDETCHCGGTDARCPARILRGLTVEQVRTHAEQIWAAAPARAPVRGRSPVAGPSGLAAAAHGWRGRGLTWWRGLLRQALLVAAVGVAAGQAAGVVFGLAGAQIFTVAGMAGFCWWLRWHPSDGALWRRRVTADRRTAARLRKLSRAGYLVVRDPAVPGSRPGAGQLVIGPTGVWVLTSERWRRNGKLDDSAGSPSWLTAAAARLRADAQAIGAAAGTMPEIRFRPLLCLHGCRVPDGGVVTGGVLVTGPQQLVATIGRGPLLTEQTVAAVAKQALAALRPER